MPSPEPEPEPRTPTAGPRLITLDGSSGEGGGQILRTALSLSLLTGRPFRIVKIRANREKPGLRPQHLAAVEAAAALGNAEVTGGAVGSRDLTFRPGAFEPRDLTLDIGTAGSTGMVLHTLYLPLALRAASSVRLVLIGGTFNTRAPSFPFLATTWQKHVAALGLPVALAMPTAGFYPRGGGRLEAWIEPGRPRALTLLDRGPLRRIIGEAGVANLRFGNVAERMRRRAEQRIEGLGLADGVEVEIGTTEWTGPGPGAALALTAEYDHVQSTFVGLGERGKPAERVAEEAVAELAEYLTAPGAGAVDPHSADQLLLPLALAEGRSTYTVAAVTEHLRTNAATIRSFLDRTIRIEEPDPQTGRPSLVVID